MITERQPAKKCVSSVHIVVVEWWMNSHGTRLWEWKKCLDVNYLGSLFSSSKQWEAEERQRCECHHHCEKWMNRAGFLSNTQRDWTFMGFSNSLKTVPLWKSQWAKNKSAQASWQPFRSIQIFHLIHTLFPCILIACVAFATRFLFRLN